MFDQVRGQTGVHNIYKFVLPAPTAAANGNGHAKGNGNGNGNGNGKPSGPAVHILNLAIAPLVSKDMQQIGRLIIFDDVTDRDESGAPAGAGRQTELDRPAGRRRGA